MWFAEVLKSSRHAAGLTQAELATRSGIARPNIATYEAGRREPLISTAETLLTAAGAIWRIDPPPEWRWTPGHRPYAVPTRLWRLPALCALRRYRAGTHLWWSGPPRTFDLSDRSQRLRAYEIVLREGSPHDISGIVDEVLLCDAWPDLVLPRELRTAWQHLIDEALGPEQLLEA
jgi:transcriptional regulator with XRE-family HTH domain